MNSNKWKSPFQRAKRERQQPAARAHLGFLEKKKDHIRRAKIFHEKERELDDLRRAAELRNPNEFYFSMITDMKTKPMQTKTKPLDEFTKEQRILLETRDMTYVQSKMQTQRNKLEKLRLGLPIEGRKGSIKIYRTVEEALKAQKNAQPEEEIQEEENPNIIALRDEIAQRETILRKLQEVYNEMKLQADMKANPNFKTIEVDDEGTVAHVWKKERKR